MSVSLGFICFWNVTKVFAFDPHIESHFVNVRLLTWAETLRACDESCLAGDIYRDCFQTLTYRSVLHLQASCDFALLQAGYINIEEEMCLPLKY